MLSSNDVSAISGLPASTWLYWARTNKSDVPAGYKLGKRWLWDEEEVRSWIESRHQNKVA